MVNVNCMGGGGYFSDDVSAKRSQVVKGHSTITNDQNDEIVEGTMLDVASDDRNVGRYVASNNLILGMTNGAHRTKNSTSGFPEVSIPLSDVASTIGATDSSKILKGTTISGVAGTMSDNGAWSSSLGLSGSVVIPKGYHNGSGKITRPVTAFSGGVYTPSAQDQTIVTKDKALTGNIICLGNANLKAENIKHGVKLFGITGTRNPSSYNAYTGSGFQGALSGGVITNVYSNSQNGSGYSHDYVFMNDKIVAVGGTSGWYSTPTPITSGSLYRNVNNPHGPQYPENTFGEPFGFVSAAKIDFTKCSKIRITGSVNYTFYPMAGFGNTVYWRIYPTIEQVYRYSATEQPGRYVRRNSVEGDGFAWWFGVKINDGEVGHSGDLPFDVTFDVSSWTTTTDQIAFYFDPRSELSLSNEWTREIMNFKLNTIEFQP